MTQATLPTPRRVVIPLTYQGFAMTMVFDMETVARYEIATAASFLDLVDRMQPLTPEQIAAGVPPKRKVQTHEMGSLLQAALAEHHPDVTRALAMQMLFDPAVQKLFGEGIGQSMPRNDDADRNAGAGGAAAGNRKARRASRSSSAGKTGSSSPRKRASA